MARDPIVHVIDDDSAARESLTFMLGTAKFAARSWESAKAFLDVTSAIQGDCIITDVRMPEVDGIELLRRLKERNINWPVIVITGHDDVSLAVEAMKQGAVDFIEKPYDSEVLLGAVRAALSSHEQSEARESQKAEVRERMAALSPRERQVLDGLVAGRPNKIIAYDLGISDRTVEIYRANVMSKMQATSLSHLVRMALIATL
jgi:two-component system, LuxR family, response regulator FixJ